MTIYWRGTVLPKLLRWQRDYNGFARHLNLPRSSTSIYIPTICFAICHLDASARFASFDDIMLTWIQNWVPNLRNKNCDFPTWGSRLFDPFWKIPVAAKLLFFQKEGLTYYGIAKIPDNTESKGQEVVKGGEEVACRKGEDRRLPLTASTMQKTLLKVYTRATHMK